jgi:hypothetical protein
MTSVIHLTHSLTHFTFDGLIFCPTMSSNFQLHLTPDYWINLFAAQLIAAQIWHNISLASSCPDETFLVT